MQLVSIGALGLAALLIVPQAAASDPVAPLPRPDTTAERRNLALRRAVYQSSAANLDDVGHLATDGHADTAWRAKVGEREWVHVDLGGPARVDGVRLSWGEGYATAYHIDVSDDGRAWATVHATEAGRGGSEEVALPTTTARHVRLVATRRAGAGGYALREWEVLGTGGVAYAPGPTPAPRADGRLDLTGGGWKVQRASLVASAGEALSTVGYADGDWLPATVPGTVLVSYLNVGAVPDPYYADQQLMVSDAFFTADFWYRNEIMVPAGYAGRRVFLNFDGINWKAEVFVASRSVGRIDGAFTRGRFDVTELATPGRRLALAVLVRKPDNPGQATVQTLEDAGRNSGVHSKDGATFFSSLGWDWIPTIRGRNTGLWNDVFLSPTGPVSLVDPFVKTDLPLPDTSRAELTIEVALANHTAQPQKAVLEGRLGGITVERVVELLGGETRTMTLDPRSHPALVLQKPALWWPNGLGDPALHRLELSLQVGGRVSDAKTVTFGVREFSYPMPSGRLVLHVNGRRVFARGGNWGGADAHLKMDAAGYEARVRLHKEMNVNMIRNWVGQTADEAFYAACDRHGILVMDDFWLSSEKAGFDPDDPALLLANAREKIKRVRNHASVVLYTGRNEGFPVAPLEEGLPAAVAELDGSRLYVPSTRHRPIGGSGPWGVRVPRWYFANRGGVPGGEDPRNTDALYTEIGLPNVPSLESLLTMMPAERLWPQNDLWGLHDFTLGSAQEGRLYNAAINGRYGTARGIVDFVRKAQLVNYESHKAMFEAFVAKESSNGALMWMSQPAWPSLVWQTYGYDLEPTAGYFGVKAASEPLHILWDCLNERVLVRNTSARSYTGLQADVRIYALDGTLKAAETVAIDAPLDRVVDVGPVRYPADVGAVHFLKLVLRQGPRVLSENFYWRGQRQAEYEALESLPAVRLSGRVRHERRGGRRVVTARLVNATRHVALAVRLKLLQGGSPQRVLPAYYSDNYVSLVPGDSKTITIECDEGALVGEPRLVVEGWNVTPEQLAVGGTDAALLPFAEALLPEPVAQDRRPLETTAVERKTLLPGELPPSIQAAAGRELRPGFHTAETEALGGRLAYVLGQVDGLDETVLRLHEDGALIEKRETVQLADLPHPLRRQLHLTVRAITRVTTPIGVYYDLEAKLADGEAPFNVLLSVAGEPLSR